MGNPVAWRKTGVLTDCQSFYLPLSSLSLSKILASLSGVIRITGWEAIGTLMVVVFPPITTGLGLSLRLIRQSDRVVPTNAPTTVRPNVPRISRIDIFNPLFSST